jgi:hypothetical protein
MTIMPQNGDDSRALHNTFIIDCETAFIEREAPR